MLAALALLTGCGGGDNTESAAPPPPATGDSGDNGQEPQVGDGEGGVELTKIGDFAEPVYVTQPTGQSELYVVEKGGTVRVIDSAGEIHEEPFLDIRDQVSTGSEQGLLSLAFAPDYERSGLLYVDYTDTEGDSRIVEYRRSADDPLRADPGSAREVLFVDQPFENHNGGLVLFGPDGDLYIGFGDGGSAGDPDRNGQDLGTMLGKILRIDPQASGGDSYSVPADNPFVGQSGARPEIYEYGLRNPWRFSFDRETDALSIGDVGQDEQEEIDYVSAQDAAGANFGWSAFEGTARFNDDQVAPNALAPILTYGRDGGCSVTGGYVVRDRNLRSLYGRYLYGDYCAGQLRSFVPSSGGARGDRLLGVEVPQLTSFGEDSGGRVYVASQDGPLYRLDPAGQ